MVMFHQKDIEANNPSVTMEKLIIIGAGCQGELLEHVINIGNTKYMLYGYLDDKFDTLKVHESFFTAPIKKYVFFEDLTIKFIIAIGDPTLRKEIFERMSLPISRYATIIHPEACIDKTAVIGEGTFISAKTIIAHNTVISNNTFIQSGTILEYGSYIHPFVSISPGVTICGNVVVEEECFIGAGSTIIQGLKIRSKTIIGAGSTVLKNIESNRVVAGSPAKFISNRK